MQTARGAWKSFQQLHIIPQMFSYWRQFLPWRFLFFKIFLKIAVLHFDVQICGGPVTEAKGD